MLSAVLFFSAIFGTLPMQAIAATADSAADPVIVTNYSEFKTALSSSTVKYIRVTKSFTYELKDTDHANGGFAIEINSEKILELNANITLLKNNMLDKNLMYSLICVDPGKKLTIFGSGTLKCGFNATNYQNGIIWNQGGTVEISGVSLEVSLNLTTYGRAIVNYGGNTIIHSGTFIGSSAMSGASTVTAVYMMNGNLTIYGGNFFSTNISGSEKELVGLYASNTMSTSPKVSLFGGSFTGIKINNDYGVSPINISSFLAPGASLINTGHTSENANTDKILKQVSVKNPSVIETIAITGVTLPAGGVSPSTVGITVPSAQGYSIRTDSGFAPKWTYNGNTYTSNFISGNTYEIVVNIAAGAGKVLDGANATINGKKAKISYAGSYCTVSCEYTATGGSLIKVDSAAITNMAIPVDGEKPVFASPDSDAPEKYTVTVFQWWDNTNGKQMTTENFIGGHQYKLYLRLNIGSGYTFSSSPRPDVTINGLPANFVEATGVGLADLIYVIEYYATGDKEIKAASAEVIPPFAGNKPQMGELNSGNPSKYNTSVNGWYDETNSVFMIDSDSFIAGNKYTVIIGFETESGYWFVPKSDLFIFINESSANYYGGADSPVFYKMTFTATDFVGVTDITGVATTGKAGIPVDLDGTVKPAAASHKKIEWSLGTGSTAPGARVSENQASAVGIGTVVVRATIKNGTAPGAAYTKDFAILFSKDTGKSIFKVTFSDGTKPIGTPQSVLSGEKAVKPAKPPAKKGYTFINWYSDKACTKQFNFKSAIKTDTTIYAKFAKNPAKVKGFKLSVKGKKITAKYKKVTSATGYEVVYGTKKASVQKITKVKKANKFYVGKKLKATKKLKAQKSYFVKMRAYKTVDGVKCYGAWTKVLSKKTK